jgi:predicted RNase H-like HicB family nuclease
MKAYTVILSPDPDVGGYTIVCPAMPGAVTEGDTREGAHRSMSEVMANWLEVAHEDGYDAREETLELVATEIASVLDDRIEAGWDMTIETTHLTPAQAVPA